MNRPLAITPGEPAGIGPDLIITLAQEPRETDWVVVGDPDLLLSRARKLGLPLKLHTYSENAASETDSSHPFRQPGELCVLPVTTSKEVRPGELDRANAPYVLAMLDAAIDGCLAGRFAAMVTGPVQKSVLNDAGIPFTGHTEYLAKKCGVNRVVMLLVAGTLRVALVTTHVPLARVAEHITRQNVRLSLEILLESLQSQFGFTSPRVLVAGLNPHAGEDGHLGREEIDVIEPVCQQLRDLGMAVRGPLPADTLFTPSYIETADAVLAMYHDQGLPVLKSHAFGQAVNVTLGLPMVRTSVDHGTALDLAGTGDAHCGSFRKALELASQLSDTTHVIDS